MVKLLLNLDSHILPELSVGSVHTCFYTDLLDFEF